MNFSQLAKVRESTRSYTDKPVLREDVEAIIEDAMLAPSACNSQPWKFIVCDGETAKELPHQMLANPGEIRVFCKNASAFVVVCETKAQLVPGLARLDQQFFAQMDIGIVAASICYAAADRGIGSCIMGCFHEKEVKEFLSIPEDVNVRLIIPFGYPDTEPRIKDRKDKSEILSFNKW